MSDSNQPTFAANDHVRVKPGVTDFDYADMPLGGWKGTVVEVQEDPCTTCLVHWSRATLTAIPLRYRTRCEQDGIDYKEKWLDQDDLEMDGDGRPAVEQPTDVTARRRSERQERDSQERWLDEGGR